MFQNVPCSWFYRRPITLTARSKQNGNDDQCDDHVIIYFNDRLKQVENSWFSRDVSKKKTKLKNFKFLPLSGKSHF